MKQLRQYRVLREIGRGGMASVYEGVHVDLERRVAIKMMLPNVAAEPKSVARFILEAKAGCTVRHPHIVEIFDFGTEDGVPYLVMELLEGEPLSVRLSRDVPLFVEDAIAILLPICDAVAHAHRRGIVHRDLKPGNVFLTPSHLRPWPKVLDFGISKRIDQMPREGITSPESMIGTLTHMAPEQIQDPSAATAASDQYALGVMLYEMVTARLPFFGASPYQLMHNILNAPIVPPSAFNPVLPKELDEIILRALERNPAKRFATVEAFGSRLLGFADRDTFALWRQASSGTTPFAGRTLDESREVPAPPPVTTHRRRARSLELRSVVLGFAAGIAALSMLGGGFASRRTPPSPPSEAAAIGTSSSIEPHPKQFEPPVTVTPVAIAPLDAESAVVAKVPSVMATGTSSAQPKLQVPSERALRRPSEAKSSLPKSDAVASSARPDAAETKSKSVAEGTNAAPIFE